MMVQQILAIGFFLLAGWALLTNRADEGHQYLQTALLVSVLAELQK